MDLTTCYFYSNNENQTYDCIQKNNKSKKIHLDKIKKNKDINNYFNKKSSKKHRLEDALQTASKKHKSNIIQSQIKKEKKIDDSFSYMFEKMNLEMNEFFENEFFNN